MHVIDAIAALALLVVGGVMMQTTLPGWRLPWLYSAAVAFLLIVVTSWEPGHPAEWMIASIAALLVSSVLLRTRLMSIDALADASELARRLAVTDELMGLLNRHGLQAQIPRLVGQSGRLDNTVCVVLTDIDGLKLANDRHGHAFGDEVIEVAGGPGT